MKTSLKSFILLLPLMAFSRPRDINKLAVGTPKLEPSITSPAPVGSLITWTATFDAGSDCDCWYRFVVRGFDQEAQLVKDYSPDMSFKWSPVEHEGLYTVEVSAKNRTTGEVRESVSRFEVSSKVTDGKPMMTPTAHPLVFLYSAPACPVGNTMIVYYLNPLTNVLQQTPPKRCDGIFSINFYLAGLRASTFYYVRHHVNDNGALTEGPLLSFTSGELPDDLPETKVTKAPEVNSAEQVLLSATLFSKFVATDLSGQVIWYYPESILFLTRPEPGGYFFGVDENHDGDQSKQILREFDLAGVTRLETNAARVNEQLAKLGKRQISGFHHEARRLSDGNIVTMGTVEQIMTDVQGAGPVNIVGDMIIVLNSNLEVVWTWDTFDRLDVHRVATQDDQCNPMTCPPLFLASTGNDWVHGNSVAETPDGSLLYSTRSQDWVIKVDYAHGYGSGDILWRLGKDGDFKINSDNPSPWFSHQHDPEFESNGMLSVLDNGNLRQAIDENAHSRGQVLRIDEAKRTVDLAVNADLGYYSFALGSAQLLSNGRYSFVAGFRQDGTGISVEVDGAGNVTSAIENSAPEYRTFRMKDMYTP